jgi:hypothetical protein
VSELERTSPVVQPTLISQQRSLFASMARRLLIPFRCKVEAPFAAFYDCSLKLCLELELLLC